MAETEYKPRGGWALAAFALSVISLPGMVILVLAKLQIIDLPIDFYSILSSQIMWTFVFSAPILTLYLWLMKRIKK